MSVIASAGPSGNISFRTRARTIDHLGRGQIADAPTAVSELWKNAWDAYATQVSLNIFDGTPAVAAVFDDGNGMSESDFINKWLVIGTESKLDGPPPPPPEDYVGPTRERQGEKGIGRLSAAFLAPVTLVLSKKRGGPISAVLVDWRLFENPFLALDDIVLPVRSFEEPSDVMAGLSEMSASILTNIGSPTEDGFKVSPPWSRYDELERGAGRPGISDKVIDFWQALPVTSRQLEEWPVFVGLAEHGTALFMLGIHHELRLWLDAPHEDEEAIRVKQRLKDILIGFTDTLSPEPVAFEYEVLTYRSNVPKRILSSSDTFDLEDFRSLEHSVEGRFDENGVFVGTLRAFGELVGERTIPPTRPLPPSRSDRPGPFSFAIATFEQVAKSSTHEARRHKELQELVDKYGGVRVYRDGLRVTPYGSADSDFFALEETRQKHAGRYFWAHRRSFGRLAFTRNANPSLRDKAGREGLVENRASRELRLLVQHLLIKLARDYFGTDAPDRADRIAETQARNLKGKKAADSARKQRAIAFRTYLSDAAKRMPAVKQRVEALSERLDENVASATDLALLRADVEQARADLLALRPVEVPASLGEAEARYRAFRDELDDAQALLAVSDSTLRDLEATRGTVSSRDAAEAAAERHKASLNLMLDGYQDEIRDSVRTITSNWSKVLSGDRDRYETAVRPLLRKVSSDVDLGDLLSLLETTRGELEAEFQERYRPLSRNLRNVVAGVDAETVIAFMDDDREDLERRVRDLNSIAQLGITVEIIGHELEHLDGQVSRGLELLPASIKTTEAYQEALTAHRALTEKLRFLSPLQLAGARIRETITGEMIFAYTSSFFGGIFADNAVAFEATTAFRQISFVEQKARIFPVFINLVNNALYWVSRSLERVIRLDFVDGRIVLGDTGPGVDRDDARRLFQLFFTRRASGRGVGLYLSRVNLEAGRHSIRYATDDDPRILSGANFIIEIRGLESGR